MTVFKTPLRVSFAGGGTDMAVCNRTRYGAVVSSAIEDYAYVTVRKRFDGDVRISRPKTEMVDSVNEIEHGLVHERDTEWVKRTPTKKRADEVTRDLSDADSVGFAIKESEPDEIRNMAAPTFVTSSIRDYVMTRGLGVVGATMAMASAMEHAPVAKIFQRRKGG
jgi:hypothetical protein